MSDHLLLLYKQNSMQPQATRSVMSALSSERNVSKNSTSWTVSTLACTFSLRIESCFSMSRFTFAETMSDCPPQTSIPTTYAKIEAFDETSDVGSWLVLRHQLLNKLIDNICRQWEWTHAKISASVPLDKLQDTGPSAEDCAVAPIAEKNLHIWQAMLSDRCTKIKTSRPGLSATREDQVPLLQSPGHRSFLHFLFSKGCIEVDNFAVYSSDGPPKMARSCYWRLTALFREFDGCHHRLRDEFGRVPIEDLSKPFAFPRHLKLKRLVWPTSRRRLS